MKTTKKASPASAGASKKVKKPKASTAPVSHGVGRRKSSVARVWMRRGKGVVTVNGKISKEYFDTDFNKSQLSLPLSLIPKGVAYDFDANVVGGGVNAQAKAIQLGMSRALVASDEAMRPILRKFRLLSVDSRLKERKKYGQRGARRKFQFVKR